MKKAIFGFALAAMVSSVAVCAEQVKPVVPPVEQQIPTQVPPVVVAPVLPPVA